MKALEANLDRCHAERRLRFTSLANAELTDIKQLVHQATGDEDLAEQTFVDAYAQRVWAEVEKADAKSGYSHQVR